MIHECEPMLIFVNIAVLADFPTGRKVADVYI